MGNFAANYRDGDAVTLEQYRAMMADRQRPLTDGFMSNGKASNLRAETAASYASPMDLAADDAQELAAPLEEIEELQPDPRRNAAPCGTPGGYSAHLRRDEIACADCLRAHRQYRADKRRKGAAA